jgi:hypothetical protein
MRANEFIIERKKSRKKSKRIRRTGGYYFPGYGYYGGSGESGEGGGDGGGGESRSSVAEGYSNTTFNVDRRKLNVPALIQKGAILVTHPHGEQGWETDDKEDWAFSLLSLYNVLQGGWPSEAKKYLKPQSYKRAEQQINSSAPNLGSDKLVYDGKYNQILWSIKKLGIPDNVAFLDKGQQGVTEGTLSVDVPNEDWLQSKIDYAKKQGRNSYGVPYMGSTTASVRGTPPRVRVMRLASLPGMRHEQTNVRKADLKWLMDYMEKTGKLPPMSHSPDHEYLPYIMVAYNGEAWVNEGNHRIMAAYRLNWQDMPIEIRYFDGGERIKDGPMYPGKIGLS